MDYIVVGIYIGGNDSGFVNFYFVIFDFEGEGFFS